jgi:hypothetical protein
MCRLFHWRRRGDVGGCSSVRDFLTVVDGRGDPLVIIIVGAVRMAMVEEATGCVHICFPVVACPWRHAEGAVTEDRRVLVLLHSLRPVGVLRWPAVHVPVGHRRDYRSQLLRCRGI